MIVALHRTCKTCTMAPSASPDIEVAKFAGQLLFRLWRATNSRTAERLGALGLVPALFALLNVLVAREGANQQQLSADMGIDPSAMVKLINDLESAGLAERRRRPGDRRAWEVSITPKGRRTLERARRSVVQVEDEVLAGLSAGDRRQLLVLLRRALVSAPPQPPWHSEEGDGSSGGPSHDVRSR
jgi:MarR family transcriptional regulator, lower aerobic nicotinate degradation pathway regulator